MEISSSRPRWLDPRQTVATNAAYQCLTKVKPVRPLVVGPSSGPQDPFPLQMQGKVIRGYRRGSNDLGIPTANLPVDDNRTPWISGVASGVYFGWVSLRLPPTEASNQPASVDSSLSASSEFTIYPMVMSIGYNPQYRNTVRSAEVHVLHDFAGRDLYGVEIRLLILGFIRSERAYPSTQDLIDDIHMDCDVACRSLKREGWSLRETGKGGLDGSWLLRDVEEAQGVIAIEQRYEGGRET